MELTTSRRALETKEPITIALIATYPEMSRALAELIEGTNIQMLDIYASFEQAALMAQDIESKVDVILTRGGTGRFIKDVAAIPVISIPITPFDLMISVSRLGPEVKKIAFANYQRAIFGTESIEHLFQKRIIQYQFTDRDELGQAVLQAKEDGCQVFIGGAEGTACAMAQGLEGIEIVSGREAIFQALTEAIEVVRVKREEKKHFARLKSAFDSLAEGICIVDEYGKISVFNPAAAHIFRLGNQNVIGSDIHDVPVSELAVAAFDKRQPQRNRLERTWDITVSASHTPIYIDGAFIGVVSTFQDVTKIQRLEGQIRQQMSQKGFKAKYTFQDILTGDPEMELTKKLAQLYARTDSTVLIEGESGTGKELFAHSIHNGGAWATGPFVTVNCAAIPEQLLESELFGYAPGAFTGAKKEGKQGLFELAHNGTIFLDEIGEMPKYLQARLLRVLQEKEVMRVGDNKIISVNCRIISATNKDLVALVAKGEFREDLYYRLSIFTIKIPPLREREGDIKILSKNFFSAPGLEHQPVKLRKSMEEQMQRLQGYRWPGNVRELSNVCARIALLQEVDQGADVGQYLKAAIDSYIRASHDLVCLNIEAVLPLKAALEEAERQYIAAILERNQNNQSKTAKQLGIGRTTLWRRNINEVE